MQLTRIKRRVNLMKKRKKIDVDEVLLNAAIGGLFAVGCYLSPSFRKKTLGFLEEQTDKGVKNPNEKESSSHQE